MEIKKSFLQTERLVLKPFSANDTEALVKILTNQEIGKTFMVPEFQTKEQAVALAERVIANSRPEDTTHLEYGIYLGNELIGSLNDCGYTETEIEIGYAILPEYWGKGYATEAVQAVLQELRQMGFQKVKAGFFEGNTASEKVMKKCAMKKIDVISEEEYRGTVYKCLHYEIEF